MDGRALTATELAGAAGITGQTASGHLAQLTAAGLLAMERQGRHRYHRLGSAEVAQMHGARAGSPIRAAVSAKAACCVQEICRRH